MLPARTRPFSRGRTFRARFRKPNARSGTQSEPRLRILLFFFETCHLIDARNGWQNSSFRKIEFCPIIFTIAFIREYHKTGTYDVNLNRMVINELSSDKIQSGISK